MSLASWKREFYPITAIQAAKTKDPGAIVEHSIRKWEGALPENLRKHGLRKMGIDPEISEVSGKRFPINFESCSLCRAYLSRRSACRECPIYLMRGHVCAAEYGRWNATGDPKPMLRLLRRTLAWVKKEGK